MILAELLASFERPIHSLNDLANSQDILIIAEKNSNEEKFIKVITNNRLFNNEFDE
jgi:hypothetical protein